MRWPLVVALVAVTAFAASAGTVGAERLITGADIKDGSITGADIKRGALKAEHLEAKSRHNVYRARKGKRAVRSTVYTTESKATNILTVTVPAGEYVIQASTSATIMTANTSVLCYFTDSANKLSEASSLAEWLSQVDNLQVTPLALVATATYSGQTTINLTCISYGNSVELGTPTLIAEQVSLVN